MQVQNDLLTQVALYLKVNVYELFRQAVREHLGHHNEQMSRAAYEMFITHNYVPKYVITYCEIVVNSME